MQSQRFDYLIRNFAASSGSRRQMLRLVAGTALAGALSQLGLDDAAAKCSRLGRKCKRRRDCCKGSVCKKRRCVCKRRLTRCGKRCRNLKNDERNCGRCGKRCRRGERCVGGACRGGGGGDGGGDACDGRCAANETCVDGFCASAFGQEGTDPGQLLSPADVGVDQNGIRYVLELGGEIEGFFRNGDHRFGIGADFVGPRGIAVQSDGGFVMADTGNHQVQKFNSSLNRVLRFGSLGNGGGQFEFPADVAVNRNGNIYVADTGNNLIQRFSENGFFLSEFGRSGNGNGEFAGPSGIAVDEDFNIYVADTDNDRIQVFDVDEEFVRVIGAGQLSGPTGLAFIDVVGITALAVADSGNDRIVLFDLDGNVLTKIGRRGNRVGEFKNPTGVALDRTVLVVADQGNHRVQVLSGLPDVLDS